MNEELQRHIDIWANADITESRDTFYLKLIAKLLQEIKWAEDSMRVKDDVIKNLQRMATSPEPEPQLPALAVCHYCQTSLVPVSAEASVQPIEQYQGELVPSVA